MSDPEALVRDTVRRITPVSTSLLREAQALLDGKTKPRGSLGRLEDLAARLCAIRGSLALDLGKKVLVVMAADHGVVAEGVSAFPQEVTRQMVLNFVAGGAAIKVLARQAGAEVVVVDMGILEPVPVPEIRERRIAAGTRNMRTGPAMSREQACRALAVGIELAHELADSGHGVIGMGEMGIGNTTASSALAAVLTGVAVEELTGTGTGIDETTRSHKLAVIKEAIACNAPDPADPIAALAGLGGFEIGGLAGLALGAASRGCAVVVDGFIASVAALIAVRLQPVVRDHLVLAHKSVEPGHQCVLRELGQAPLLDLDLRLGEGSGAALAIPLMQAATAIVRDMASFQSAGVSEGKR